MVHAAADASAAAAIHFVFEHAAAPEAAVALLAVIARLADAAHDARALAAARDRVSSSSLSSRARIRCEIGLAQRYAPLLRFGYYGILVHAIEPFNQLGVA